MFSRSLLRSGATTAAVVTLAGAGLAATAAAPTALAATTTATPSATAGLYGSSDPTYDGAYRQSLALLGLHATGVTPSPAAVTWLLAQQCSDGGWEPFRADLAKACTPAKEDSNSTAAAVTALDALGHGVAADKGIAWLKKHQNADGGIGYNPGSPSDPNSTGLFVGALHGADIDPASVTASGKSPYDSLQSFQLGCSAGAGAGGFYYPGSGAPKANDLATVQAVPGLVGLGLVVPATSQTAGTTGFDCPTTTSSTPAVDRDGAAKAGAAYLAKRLQDNKGVLPSGFGSGPDYSTTAQAVLALVATGTGKDATELAVGALQKSAATWLTGPAQQGLALLLNAATGSPSATFGGRDVAAALGASVQSGATASPSASASGSTKPTASAPASGSAAPTTAATTSTPASAGTHSTTSTGTGTTGPQLAETGAGSTAGAGALGAALLGLGGGLLLLARRRPNRRPAHRA
ncbi:MAG: prenyltransferase/squalene oxidase repeat-containing protein [Actinomycetes bacterium]